MTCGTGWYAAGTRRSPGTMTLRMKWEATTLARRLKPCGTDAPCLAGRQLGLLRTIKNEGMTQPPPRSAAGAAQTTRLLPDTRAGGWRCPCHMPPVHSHGRGHHWSTGLPAASPGRGCRRRRDALGRQCASPKGIADLARDAAFPARRDTKLLTHFFLFPFKTTARAALRESHVPDLTDFFPE